MAQGIDAGTRQGHVAASGLRRDRFGKPKTASDRKTVHGTRRYASKQVQGLLQEADGPKVEPTPVQQGNLLFGNRQGILP